MRSGKRKDTEKDIECTCQTIKMKWSDLDESNEKEVGRVQLVDL